MSEMMRTASRDHAIIAIRSIQAKVLSALGIIDARLRSQNGSAAVLMYHRVLRDDEPSGGVEPGMFVRASTFDEQIRWLKRRFQIATLGEVLSVGRSESDPPVVAITFDDGWRDNLTVGWPILQRHQIRATVFLVRDWCLGEAANCGSFLSPAEIRTLAAGGIEFGAHTATHPALDLLSDGEVQLEMKKSKEAVEHWTDRACDLFAYPYGRQRDRTVDIARTIFRGSVTVQSGWWTRDTDPGRIPRIAIHQDMGSSRPLFEARLACLI